MFRDWKKCLLIEPIRCCLAVNGPLSTHLEKCTLKGPFSHKHQEYPWYRFVKEPTKFIYVFFQKRINLISPKFIPNLFGTWESVFWRLEIQPRSAKPRNLGFKINWSCYFEQFQDFEGWKTTFLSMKTYLTRHTSFALFSPQQNSLPHLFSFFKSCIIWCFNFKMCVSEKDYYFELHTFCFCRLRTDF